MYPTLFTSIMLCLFLSACGQTEPATTSKTHPDTGADLRPSLTAEINATLDSFNRAAAAADYNAYFNFFTPNAVFIGTDATEYWTRDSFMIWAKPYFDKKRTWNFKSLQRHVYFDSTSRLAWFDELLETQMKICRGSGVVVKQGANWKVQQYVLSMTIPNDLSDTIVSLKTPVEQLLIDKLKK